MDTRFKIYEFSGFKHISFFANGSSIRISSVSYTISCYISFEYSEKEIECKSDIILPIQ